MVAHWTADQQVERLIMHLGNDSYIKIHLVSPTSYPRSSLAVQNRGLKHQSFHFCFSLSDLYTFDDSEENAMVSYNGVCEAYNRIFQALDVPFLKGTYLGMCL